MHTEQRKPSLDVRHGFPYQCLQGGVIDENEDAIIQRLNNVVKHLSRT